MSKKCKHVRQDGFNCGSYAFNLYKDDIDQGDLCDVHYWQAKAQRTWVGSGNLEDSNAYLTQPAQRTWVSLTDDQIKEIVGPWGDTPIKGYTRKLIDQIDAKLRENNNG